MPRRLLTLGTCLIGLLFSAVLTATEARVAVASNFLPTARQLAAGFKQRSGHTLRISSASSGKLYAQIHHGAPFDLLLSADARRPERLATEGLARPDKVRPYAIGQLVFWMPKQEGDASRCRARLLEGNLRLALANPRTAPYGSAAWETLEALGFDPAKLPLIQGENVAQAFAFVASGSADGGFVAASQPTAGNREGCRWPVPGELHAPIVQKAALLKRGEPNPAARAFFAYLLGPEARQVIRRAGYLLP